MVIWCCRKSICLAHTYITISHQGRAPSYGGWGVSGGRRFFNYRAGLSRALFPSLNLSDTLLVTPTSVLCSRYTQCDDVAGQRRYIFVPVAVKNDTTRFYSSIAFRRTLVWPRRLTRKIVFTHTNVTRFVWLSYKTIQVPHVSRAGRTAFCPF